MGSLGTGDAQCRDPLLSSSLPQGAPVEIVSGPTNLLIDRHPIAGHVAVGLETSPNGISVPIAGANFGDFNMILVYIRGVHELLEEFIFQQYLRWFENSGNARTRRLLGSLYGGAQAGLAWHDCLSDFDDATA